MPSKVKANAIAAGSAGFLKPTFSSLCKVVEKPDGKPLNSHHIETKVAVPDAKKNGAMKSILKTNTVKNEAVVLPIAHQDSPLHSSSASPRDLAAPDRWSGANGDAKIDPDKNKKTELSPLKNILASSEFDENDIKIRDARRVCDELRIQIEGLKLQQQAFHNRLGQDNGELTEVESSEQNHANGTDHMNHVKETQTLGQGQEHKKYEALEMGDARPQQVSPEDEAVTKLNELPMKPKILLKSFDDKDSYMTDDSFNLHGSVTSSDVTEFMVKDEWLESKGLPKEIPPNVVIKRLISERERYKKKVKHLQTALNRLKKQKTSSISRSPDIAAHDIVYFNADMIGEGHISYVYSGTVYKNQKAAIKKLIRPDMMSSSDRSYLAAEAGLLMSLHHQNIVEVYGVSTAPLQPLVVMELVKGKSLESRLHSSDGWPLSPVEYYSIARDSAVGLAYLHGQKPPVLHLNLRPCNILIDSNGRAKISDFGFSKIRLDAGISNQVNLAYLAPELLTFPVHLTTKLDVYSYGMILWEMATMSEPYKNLKPSQILEVVGSGKRLDIPCELPSGFHAIISRCWDHSALQRPSCKELIILLETMILPEEWEKAISKSGLQRADTKGIITPRDGNNNDSPRIAERTSYERPRHREPGRNGMNASEKRKILDEMLYDSDMKSCGYNLHKNDHTRQDSDKYLRGFSPKASNHHSNPNTPTRGNSARRRSLITKLSPYKYSFLNTSPVIPSQYYGRYSTNGEPPKQYSSKQRYSAARNLNDELKAQADATLQTTNGRRLDLKSAEIQDAERFQNGIERIVAASQTGSRQLSEIDTPIEVTKVDDIPLPLMNEDMRYHDQQLSVETPKIVTGHRNNVSKSKPSLRNETRPRSPENLRTAVSIPYLKYDVSKSKRSLGNDPRPRSPENLRTAVSIPHLKNDVSKSKRSLGNDPRPRSPENLRTAVSIPHLKNDVSKSKRSLGNDPRPRSPENLRTAVSIPHLKNNVSKSKPSLGNDPSPRSPENLRTAVSIPYLKDLRSGDETSSTSETVSGRSQFDEKLNSYVTDACQAESRSYVDAKGWRSDRSALLNKPISVPPSDQIKVRSLGSTGTGPATSNYGRRVASSAISESPETIMTAVYKPNEEKRRELYTNYRKPRQGSKYDDIISPTISDDNSVDSSRRIVVASVPSTAASNAMLASDNRQHVGHGNLSRPRHFSDGKGQELKIERKPNRYLRRENSWNKLKNSYSPEPLLPHFATSFESTQCMIPPPSLPGSESPDKGSAFTPLKLHHNKHSTSRPKRIDSAKSESSRTDDTHQALLPTYGIASHETDGGSTSTLSGATNDDIGDTLTETARELANVSGILENAAQSRKKKTSGRKTQKK